MESPSAVEATSQVTLQLEKGTNKLLSSLVQSTKSGQSIVSIDDAMSEGMIAMSDELKDVRDSSGSYLSMITLFASSSSIRDHSLSDGPVKDRTLHNEQAIHSYEEIISSWLADRNWIGLEDNRIKFLFGAQPQVFAKMVAAGALYTKAVGYDERPELVRLARNGRNLTDYFPDKEEVCYVYHFCRMIDSSGNIQYCVRITTVVMYWQKNETQIIPRYNLIGEPSFYSISNDIEREIDHFKGPQIEEELDDVDIDDAGDIEDEIEI